MNTGVIDQFLNTFTTYIDSGFGLLNGDVAFLATTLVSRRSRNRPDSGGRMEATGARPRVTRNAPGVTVSERWAGPNETRLGPDAAG